MDYTIYLVNDENVLMIYPKSEGKKLRGYLKNWLLDSDLKIPNTSMSLLINDKPFLLLVMVVDLLIAESAHLLHSYQLKSVTLL